MKRKSPNRYRDGELFICQGGTFGPRGVEIDHESLRGENLKLSKWYDKLPQDGGYRFRAGSLGGKLWAEISIEFLHFCDAVEHWSYVCRAPADEAGKVIKRITRRPEISLYWAHLENVVKRCKGSMEVMHESPNNGKSWIMAPMPFVDLAHAMTALEKAKKEHPRQICTLEKYDRTGQIVVTICERDTGRPERQVEVCLPIRPFANRAEIRDRINAFLVALGDATGVSPLENLQVARGMRHTVVNVI